MTGLPPIDAALIPADVRSGGTKERQLYQAALSFESMLTRQLSQSLAQTANLDGSDDGSDDDSTGEGATSMLSQMLPDALADGLASAGGLGLAPSLYKSLGGAK